MWPLVIVWCKVRARRESAACAYERGFRTCAAREFDCVTRRERAKDMDLIEASTRAIGNLDDGGEFCGVKPLMRLMVMGELH
jgi:hypothetical protein